MDKTPKERIVFDEGVYYGDEGSEISIEDITSREGITVEEVLDSYTEEEIFENAMNMMDIDRSEELAGLKAFLDGSDSPLSSYDNPLGGNRIIARGSIGRWDGTRHGMTAYRDFDDITLGEPRPLPLTALYGACIRLLRSGVRGTSHRPASRNRRVHIIRHHERRGRSGCRERDRA